MEITRSISDDKIMSYRSQGHANYDVHGKDIVCAGVSAVTSLFICE
ncbi:ribosomal-processing cysteine protease Prp [Neobacillus driksii]|nr:ribosomal-processing cysteine protease Prp [Neobacillus niacini]